MNARITLLLFPILLLLVREANANIIFIASNPSCGNPVGWAKAVPNGGVAPYTYLWETGAMTDSIGGLPAGTYTVTVTDNLGAMQMDSIQLVNTAELEVFNVTSYILDQVGGMHPCPGQCDGGLVMHQEYINGQPPYDIWFDQGTGQFTTDAMGNPAFGGFCNEQEVTFHVADALGCSGSATQTIVGPIGLPLELLDVLGACGGGSNGSVQFIAPQDPFTFPNMINLLNDLEQVIDYCPLCYDTLEFTALAPGDYTMRHTWGAVSADCYVEYPFTVPDLGTTCGNVSGRLYIDHNGDCTQDTDDVGLPLRVLEILPGPTYAVTDAQGNYSRNLLLGDFTIAPTGADLLPLCPATSPVPFTISEGAPLQMVNLGDSSTTPLDLGVWTYDPPVRPGFTVRYYASVNNFSAQYSGPVTASFTFDPAFTLVDHGPAGSVAGNTITWNFPPQNAFAHQAVWIDVQLPPDPGLIGTDVTCTFTCSNTLTESTLTNNSEVMITTVTGSFDPNDKTVRTSSGLSTTQYFIDQDSTLTYTIRFQNTGTDTAFTVAVHDTLDADLDLSTLEIGIASHPFTPVFDDGRVLRFQFDNILLPDSNTNEPASHGFITFRMRPLQPVLAGTVISNIADIYFDFNPPVITNDAVIVADFSTSISGNDEHRLLMYPNPATDVLTISWRGGFAFATVLTPDGRVVMAQRLSSGNSTIDLHSLQRGAYVINVQDDGGRASARFIKL